MSVSVPAMLLQPLIENAMQHGLEEKEGKGQLTIACCIEEEHVIITLTDDGVGCNFDDENYKEGIGLTNVKSRLAQLYGSQYEFSLNNNQFGGVTVSIKLAINLRAVEQ